MGRFLWWLKLKLDKVYYGGYFSIYRRYKNFTMTSPEDYVTNLRLTKKVQDVQGSVVECGVWRGGVSAGFGDLMPGHKFWLFDSFEGLPAAKAIDGPAALDYQADTEAATYLDNCRAEQAEAEKAMSLSKATDVNIVKGWFKDSLPSFPKEEKIALLRLDGDWYESIMDCMELLYPKAASFTLVPIGAVSPVLGSRFRFENKALLQQLVVREPVRQCDFLRPLPHGGPLS